MERSKFRFRTRFALANLLGRFAPAQTVLASFILIILLGAFVLSLPVSQNPRHEDIAFADAFFTAASAVCVTGLVTVSTAEAWSFFGKLVILGLIQVGGLGLIAFLTYLGVHLGRKITLKERLAIRTAFNNTHLQGMVRMVRMVVKGTVVCEGLGALILFLTFRSGGMEWHKAFWYGVFHAVSAFCNAGFDLIGGDSLTPYAARPAVNITVMALVILGGVGFSVWMDIAYNVRIRLSADCKRRGKFSLHTKLALLSTAALILFGTVFFFIGEFSNPRTLGGLGIGGKLARSLFQSVNLRTAGFHVFDQAGMTDSSKFMSALLMMVGGSPGGTAGGIKTVTVAVVLCSVWAVAKGRYSIDIFGRNIPVNALQKALAIIIIMLMLLGVGTALLAFTERDSVFEHNSLDLFFEAAAALGTTGLSTGITPHLSLYGKLLLVMCMIVGRIGPISIMISLTNSTGPGDSVVRYPREDVLIG